MKRFRSHPLLQRCLNLLIAFFLCIPGTVHPVLADTGQDAAQVQKKLDLATGYLESKSAAKIESSGNEEAIQFLDKAREFLEQARSDLETGKTQQAAENADQSIRAFLAAGTASRKSDKPASQTNADNEAVREEIDTYLESFKEALAEKGPAMAGHLDQQRVKELLARAEKLQAAGDDDSAASALNEAKRMVIVALTKIRSNETVVYTREFQTPADEYRYESERYDAYISLSQKVLNSNEFEQSRMMMFDKLKEKSDQLYQEASNMAGKGDYEQAIARMDEAVKKLVQGLQMLGMSITW